MYDELTDLENLGSFLNKRPYNPALADFLIEAAKYVDSDIINIEVTRVDHYDKQWEEMQRR